MNFFRRRPLVIAISLGIAASAAALFLPGALKLCLLGLILTVVTTLVIVLWRRDVRSLFGVPSTSFLIMTWIACAGLILGSFFFFDVHASPYNESFDAKVSGTVIEIKSSTGFSRTYVAELDSVGIEPTKIKGLVYCDFMSGLDIGDKFEADVTFGPLGDFYSFYDVSKHEMLANGYVFACHANDSMIRTGTSDSFSVKLSSLRQMLKAKFSYYLDRQTSALATAMLLGDRDDLGRIRRDFSYMGISHLLAISGLHLSIMCSLFIGALENLWVPYKVRHTLGILFIVFYMILTGLPVSIVRSGIMLILLYLARIFDQNSDTLSSLFVSGFLILLFSPSAICDKSFVLSFTATLGIILISQDARRLALKVIGHGKKNRSKHRRFTNVMAVIGATVFVLVPQWIYFGEISLLSVPATLLMTPIFELLLTLLFPYAVCAAFDLHFLCRLFAPLIGALTVFIEFTASKLANISPLISLQYPFVWYIVVVSVAAVVYMVIKNYKSWIYTLIPFTTAVVMFIFCAGIWNLRFGEASTLSYVHNKTEEAIVIVSSGQNMVIDMSSGSKAPMFLATKALSKERQTTVDSLLLTHLHRKHKYSVLSLLNQRIVKEIILPQPIDEYESNTIIDILEAVEPYGVNVRYYSRDDECIVEVGNVLLELPKYTKIRRSDQPLLAMNFITQNGRFSYAGSAIWEDEYMWSFVDGSHTILLGRHGPLYKTPPSTVHSGSITMATPDHPMWEDFKNGTVLDLYTVGSETIPHFLLEP